MKSKPKPPIEHPDVTRYNALVQISGHFRMIIGSYMFWKIDQARDHMIASIKNVIRTSKTPWDPGEIRVEISKRRIGVSIWCDTPPGSVGPTRVDLTEWLGPELDRLQRKLRRQKKII